MNKKNRKIALVLAITIAVLAVIYFFPKLNIAGKAISSSNLKGKQENIVVTKENFPSYLSGLSIVQDLPKNSIISLRVDKKSYILTKGKVEEKAEEDIDAEVFLNSKYIEEVNKIGFCSAVQEARKNNEMRFELKKSKVSLLWKYKGMMKYKSCLGF